MPQVKLLSMPTEVVGGIGDGGGGVSYSTTCGSSTRPSLTVALPVTVNAVTLLVVHEPTPVRGVDSVPLIIVGLPCTCRLPLVPTSPSVLTTTGLPALSACEL